MLCGCERIYEPMVRILTPSSARSTRCSQGRRCEANDTLANGFELLSSSISRYWCRKIIKGRMALIAASPVTHPWFDAALVIGITTSTIGGLDLLLPDRAKAF